MKTAKITVISLLNLPKDYRQTTNGLVNFSFSLKMYPNKVYHCPCVSLEIKLCLVNGHYSLKNICKKLNQSKYERQLYSCKCGDGKKDIIFSCINHMELVIFSVKEDGGYFYLDQKTKDSCKFCIRKYLQSSYSCCYDKTDFDVPIEVKKKKKVLCLRLKKI